MSRRRTEGVLSCRCRRRWRARFAARQGRNSVGNHRVACNGWKPVSHGWGRVGPRVAPAPLLLATRSGSELSRDARRDRSMTAAGASASATDVQAAAPITKEAACGARPLRARRAMRTR